MRKLFLLICVIGLIRGINAQAFYVGNTCCNYNLVNKTFALPASTCATSSDSYSFDIDGDLTTDIKIESFISPACFSAGSQSRGITVTTTSGCQFVYSTAPTCPYRYYQNLAFGTPFNAAMNWSIYPASWNMGQNSPYVYYESIQPTSFSFTCSVQANPYYVGFRKILPSNDTIYGWMQMNTFSTGKLIDYAYTCGTHTAAPPTSTITTAPTTLCKGDSLALNAIPSGGFFSGVGVSGAMFKTSSLAPGVYQIYYRLPNSNGCSTSSSVLSVTVSPLPLPVFTMPPSIICSSDTLVLVATPPGGVFSGVGVSGNVYSPPIGNFGNQTVYYTYTDLNGCSSTISYPIFVSACVGISEFTKETGLLKIFPSPNDGEFEVRATKEETIYICSELGQIVKKVELNSENDFSSKITGLPSGVYCVGNKFYRQKIVVIK